MLECDDRLSRLSETHVVGEDGASSPEQESDALDLVREEAARQFCGCAERQVRVVRRQRQQLGKGGGLGIEGLVHGSRES